MSFFERGVRSDTGSGGPGINEVSCGKCLRGFSLLELMMCVGLLALAIIFIIVLFTQMLNAATKGGNLSVATYLASEQLDQLTYNACTEFNSLYMPKWDNVEQKEEVGSGARSLNHVMFYLYDSAQSLGSSAATNLYQVTAEVEWWQHVHNQASLLDHLKLSRLIYVDPASCP